MLNVQVAGFGRWRLLVGSQIKVANPRLSIRSAKARDIARRVARREGRTIADVTERALEAYEVREAAREPASSFYARQSAEYGTDVDLEAIIRQAHRRTATMRASRFAVPTDQQSD